MVSLGFVVSAAVLTSALGQAATPSERERFSLDPGWRFALGHATDLEKDFGFGSGSLFSKSGDAHGPAKPGFDDRAWRVVDLPHDWVVEQDFGTAEDSMLHSFGFRKVGREFPASSIGWYRKSFEIPVEDVGRRISIDFDGVFRDCAVWLNGQYLDRHLSGYIGFGFDVTDMIQYGGRNVLTVRVDATHHEGWFYEGAGIYRHVWLTKTSPVHLARWGQHVVAEPKEGKAEVRIAATVQNDSQKPAHVVVRSWIDDPGGREVARFESKATAVAPSSGAEIAAKGVVTDPKLWSIEHPNLYQATTEVVVDGKVFDRMRSPFGIRSIKFDSQKGFFLNGRRVQIQGVCCHQDHAGVGSAVPDAINEFRIRRLKEMGCNAYRTSHHPPTPELLDVCDRLGMLVMDETRLLGSSPEMLGQLRSMVLRDRNHPSVILWSIGNEEWLVQGSELGKRMAQTMIRTIRELDPTRPTTYAGNNNNQYEGVNSVVDVRGWNYMLNGDVNQYLKDHPHQPNVGSEEASTVGTRGEYANDPAKGYVGAYDANKPGWGATAETWVKYYDARPWVAGAFVWTGFDYRGEPTPYSWPCINSHFGIMDTCGFPKDNFFYYQAWWSTRPVLHLFPHWNWAGQEGRPIDVWCHTNAEEVELFLNGRSLGRKRVERLGHLEWKVPYQPGVLEAKAYRSGVLSQSAKVETTGLPARVVLQPDRDWMAADGRDALPITVSVVDHQGRIVPQSANTISFEVEGDARIIGVGNGDPSSHEADQYPVRTEARPISAWKAAKVAEFKAGPETSVGFDDSAWERAQVTSNAGSIAQAGDVFAYRASFDLSPSEATGMETLTFGQIDDEGLVFLNGSLVGQTNDWQTPHSIEVRGKLRTGRNVLAVLVLNRSGRGGLARGVDLVRRVRPTWRRSVFHGLAQTILRSGTREGAVRVTARSPGLEPGGATIKLRQAARQPSL